MELAIAAAPKPLSILTTDTPLAQLSKFLFALLGRDDLHRDFDRDKNIGRRD